MKCKNSLILSASLILVQFINLESSFAQDHSISKPVHVLTVSEEGSTIGYLLEDLTKCEIAGSMYFCGTYVDSGYLNSKKVYINPANVIIVAEFSSKAEYQASIKKYNNTEQGR